MLSPQLPAAFPGGKKQGVLGGHTARSCSSFHPGNSELELWQLSGPADLSLRKEPGFCALNLSVIGFAHLFGRDGNNFPGTPIGSGKVPRDGHG